MSNEPNSAGIPADNPARNLVVRRPDSDESLVHLGIVGDTYTILLGGEQTAGKFCLIDMHVPPGGGPAPHRHDFEETFTVLDGEIEVMFRGEKQALRKGETANIPANAPHAFKNVSDAPARLLCLCAPAGNEEFFLQIGVRVPGRTTPPPPMNEAEKQAFKEKAAALAPKYKSELLPPE